MALLHFGNLPLELDLGQRRRLGQIHLHAVAGGLDIADVHQSGESRRPQASDRAAASIHGQMVARPLVEPARRHHPCVLAAKVALLRTWDRGLVPGMILVHRISQRIGFDEGLLSSSTRRSKNCPAGCGCSD